MQRKDYYGILGVARDADENAIKTAYRRLAIRNHPDTNRDDPQAEDRFKEISEAYEVLSSSVKKSQYDLGRDPLAGPSFHPSAFDPWIDPFYESCFPGDRCRGGGLGRALGRKRRDFHGLGTRPGRLNPHRSDHNVHDLALTPAEALKGTERDIRLHAGPGTVAFTVSIPAGVENGALLSFKHKEIELHFRVRIAE